MKETFLLWKTIFSTPAEGYRKITRETKVGFPLLLLVVVLTVAALALLPIWTSDEFAAATGRAVEDYLAKSGNLSGLGAPQPDLSSVRVVLIAVSAVWAVLNLIFLLMSGALLVWCVGFVLREKIAFGLVLRLFVFTWAVYVWQAFFQSIVLLFSDFRSVLSRVRTLGDLAAAQRIPLDASFLLPRGSVSPIVLFVIGFVTNIFNVIFFVMLATGLRALSPAKTSWKIVLATLAVVLLYFFWGLAPSSILGT